MGHPLFCVLLCIAEFIFVQHVQTQDIGSSKDSRASLPQISEPLRPNVNCVNSLLPLAKGNYWVYSANDQTTDTLVITVLDYELIGGFPFALVQEKLTRKGRRDVVSYEYRSCGEHDTVFSLPYPLHSSERGVVSRSVWYNGVAKAGDSWKSAYCYIASLGIDSIGISLVSSGDTLVISAHSYFDCLGFEVHNSELSYVDWLTKSVGIIRRAYTGGKVFDLRNYSLSRGE